MLRLKEKYQKEVIPKMMERFGCKNPMAVPKIEKVIVNTGFGKLVSGKSADEQKKIWGAISNDLTMIVGQKPILTKAKKSIAGFKTRIGLPIGAKVSLRNRRMYDFLDRLINIAIPRSRDFQGIDAKSIDKGGNLTIGVKEHISFPEILPERAKNIFGLEVTIVTNAENRAEGIELFKLLGFPIKS